MRIFRFLIFLFLVAFSVKVFAQKEPEKKQPRILILLDESSSMIEKWQGDKQRYKVAGEIILRLMDSLYKINDQAEFALRVFGHQSPVQEHNCFDTKREVMFSKDNYTQMSLRLADIKPLGVTPIAYALQQAAENDLTDESQYAYSIILLTDGGESCGGDICEVVKKLLAQKIFFKPYILSLVDYAPLRTEYACLGSYLQVVNDNDIPKTIDSIVTSFRPAMTMTTVAYKRYMENQVPIPSALQIKNPDLHLKTEEPAPAPIQKVTVPVVKAQEPEINKVAVTKTTEIKEQPVKEPAPIKVAVPPTAKLPDEPKPLPVAEIKTLPKRGKTYLAMHYASGAMNKVPVPASIPMQPEPRPVVETFPKPAPPPSPAPKPKPVVKPKPTPPAPKPTVKTKTPDNNYVISTTDSKETTLEVYFEDGKGNFYHSTPQMLLSDPRTGNTMKTFYRTVDAKGNPDPQKVPAGTYDLTVANGGTHDHNIVIQPNQDNKLIILIKKSSLGFIYKPNKKRPVTEFKALVTMREIGGRQETQLCTDKVEYEPGTYHVSVNTFPPSEFYLDLDMESEADITILEPGWVQIMNTNPMGKVTLYTQRGDQFLPFYKWSIDGVPASQKLRLQPGPYKVHFIKDPKEPMADETVIDFQVKSNEVTEVILK